MGLDDSVLHFLFTKKELKEQGAEICIAEKSKQNKATENTFHMQEGNTC